MFEIGTVVKPQGIRGELRVYPTTDDPSRFALLDKVFIRHKGTEKPYTITHARVQKGVVVLTVEEVTDRTTAESLVGAVLLIPDEWALPLDEDEYFVRDLIGLAARDENGEAVGTITDVLRTGANDVYVITPETGDAFMIPAIKDVIREANMKERFSILHLLDGLRDLVLRGGKA